MIMDVPRCGWNTFNVEFEVRKIPMRASYFADVLSVNLLGNINQLVLVICGVCVCVRASQNAGVYSNEHVYDQATTIRWHND